MTKDDYGEMEDPKEDDRLIYRGVPGRPDRRLTPRKTAVLGTISMAVSKATSNEIFAAAFSNPSKISDRRGNTGIEIDVSEISTRDGLKYMEIQEKMRLIK